MTTLVELRQTVSTLQQLAGYLGEANSNFQAFISKMVMFVNDADFSSTIDVNAFITAQTTMYLALLTKIEIAADGLGSDILH